jgi:AcrR family transcriptional regulator
VSAVNEEPAGAPVFRPPQQARSREAFLRVLDAGTELLEEGGFEAFTIGEVSRRAGVSVGSIYGRANKDGLFLAIHQRALEQIDDQQTGLLAEIAARELPPGELIAAAVWGVSEVFRVHGKLLRVFMLRGPVDAVINQRGSEYSARGADVFERLLLTCQGAITHPEPALAVDVCFRLVYSTLARRVTQGPTFESRQTVAWERLVDELGLVCAAYLLMPRKK